MELNPTMDARIVHSVGVSNKKELSTLHHKERSLKSAKDVQEHIHRREEKELIRQLTKLQDEKTRRHPDMLNSRSHSHSRTNSRLSCGSHNASKTNMILQVNHTKGQLPGGGKLAGGKSIHNATIGSRSHLAGPEPPTQPGMQRGRSSHQALINRRQSTDIMQGGIGHVPSSSGQYTSVSDLVRGHVGVPGVGSRHTSIGVSPQQSSLVYEMNEGPPPVHQPAGYGHTIKEHCVREGLNKKRPHHSYMDPKGGSMHRRISSINAISMEDRMKGSHQMLARPLGADTGSRFSLNTTVLSQHQGPRASSHTLAGGGPRSRESGHMLAAGRGPTSSHGMSIPSRFLISRLFSGQAVLEENPDQESQESKRRPHRSSSDHSSSDSGQSETVLKTECHDDLEEDGEENSSGSDHKVHFKEEKKEKEEKEEKKAATTTRKEGGGGKSDHVVAARQTSASKAQEERKKSNRGYTRKTSETKEQSLHQPTQPKGKKTMSKSSHVVKLSNGSKESKHDKTTEDHGSRREHFKKAKSKGTSHSHIHIPAEVLNDLHSALYTTIKNDSGGANIDELLAGNIGSSSAYDPSSNSMHNRQFRAKLRALQFVNTHMAAQRQQLEADPSNFDPLQVLRCRYLRLSQSNIDSLTEMCRESGIEVGIHPHMNIEDIGNYVFGNHEKKPKSGNSSSSTSSLSIKQVLV